jgi:rhodanese-related sulfurtransferase
MLTPGVPTVTIRQAAQLEGSVVFLDCRERAEYEVSHLHNAVWVGYNDFDLSRVSFAKEEKLIAYCSIGKRSDVITKRLLQEGYTDVRNLVGGIFEWSNQGFPVYKFSAETVDVHVYNAFWGRWLKKGNKIW